MITSPPFIPLQGESLQGEPLSVNMERGIGSQNVNCIKSKRTFCLLKIIAPPLAGEKTQR
jgi:hypothetical protein